MEDRHILWSFAAYTVLWETIIFGFGFYAIAALHASLWWALLLLFISGQQWKPAAWRDLVVSAGEAGTADTWNTESAREGEHATAEGGDAQSAHE